MELFANSDLSERPEQLTSRRPPLGKKASSSKSLREVRLSNDLTSARNSADLAPVIREEPENSRKLRNLDGTEMTAEDYLKAVQIMKEGGDMPILGFGFKNSKIAK